MKRLYSLDALRGIAAMAVVLWHWQHFYALTGDWQDGWRREGEPLFALFKPIYLEGWAAVDLFFALSGFVFFWLYARPIAEARVSVGGFALKRVSRLYPLHVLTLLAVVVLQQIFRDATGSDFVYAAGDWGRFAAHLVLAQQWLPPSMAQTFNGPAWTVSIEAGLYVLFFALCRQGFCGPKSALALVPAGLLLLGWNEFIGRGVTGFFAGGAVFFAVERLRTRPDAAAIARSLGTLAIALWAVAIVEVVYAPLHAAAAWAVSFAPAAVAGLYKVHTGRIFLGLYAVTVVPATIAALALREAAGRPAGRLCRHLSRLGDLSFSTYMLHFPLQLICALIALHYGFTTALFEHPAVLLAFYGVLIGLACLSWRYFEIPAQRAIRNLVASGGPSA